MRFTKIRRTLLSLIGVSLAYVAYTICVVPFVEPSKRTDRYEEQPERELDSRSTDQYVQELAPLFPEGSWELDHPKVLRSDQATILLQEFEELPDHRLHIKPCTIVFYGSNRNGSDSGPTIMQAPQGATLEFDEPLDMSSGSFKPVRGQLVGGIRIVRGGTKAAEDLELVTSNVVISSNQVWTRDQVSFRLGNTYGTGSGLLITRSPKDEPDTESNSLLNELGIFELQQLDRLSFRMEQDDLFDSFTNPADQTKNVAASAKPPTPTKVEVRCKGPLRFDPKSMKAIVEDNVTISRTQQGQLPDTMIASRLTMKFSNVTKVEDRAPQANDDSRSSSRVEMTQLIAEGSPLIIDAKSQQAYLESKRLEYYFATRKLKLFGVNPFATPKTAARESDQVRLRGPNYQIIAPSIDFENHEDKSKWRLLAEGAGSFVGSHDGRSEVRASWSRGLSMSPIQGQQVLRIDGNAVVQTPGTGSIGSDVIELWLQQVSEHVGTRLDGGQVIKTTTIPTRLVTVPLANQKTEIDSPQFRGALAKLDILFQKNPNPVPQTSAATNGSTEVRPASFARSGDPLSATKLKSKYRVDGGELTAWVDPDTQDVHRMIVRGQSRIIEETTPGQRPFLIEGNAIDLTLIGDVPIVHLVGSPAKLNSPELDVVGNTIEFDGSQNLIHIPGAGSLTIQATKDMFGGIARQADRDPRAAIPPRQVNSQGPTVLQPINVEWTQGLHFDGEIVTISGSVQATGEDLSFATDDVKITLDRRLDLSKLNQGKVRPELRFVSARGGVTAAVRSRDELDTPKTFQQVAAQDLDVDFTTGDIIASGPGRLSYTTADELMPSIAATPTRPLERSATDELSHLSVAFSTQLKGNMDRHEAHLHDNIRMWLGPVDDWTTQVDPTQRISLRKNDVWMSCFELFVLETPTVTTVNGRKPIELLARGEAYVEGQLYAAKGHQIKYAEEKSMMTLEGDTRRPAQLWQRRSADEQGTSQGRVRRIRFWPKSQKVMLDGAIGFDISSVPTGTKK